MFDRYNLRAIELLAAVFTNREIHMNVCRVQGVRRDKPACCKGMKSPTGKGSSESILVSSLADRNREVRLKRR